MIPQTINETPEAEQAAVVRLAVFDFDGTSISGNSPVLLVKYLNERKMLKKRVLVKILVWAFAYKFRLPQSESWARSLVFSAFLGQPKEEVDQFLGHFYDTRIEPRFRIKAEQAMKQHRVQGDVVMVVSATFEPIVLRAMESHSFDHQVSTRMKVDAHGAYTNQVDGEPVEGEQKLKAIVEYADAVYGRGRWLLAHAYGDHHSDRALLTHAEHAVAVTPDNPLERTARRLGWDVVSWD